MECPCLKLLRGDEDVDDKLVDLLLERISKLPADRLKKLKLKVSEKRSRDRSLQILSQPFKDEDLEPIKTFLNGVAVGKIDFWNLALSAPNGASEQQRRILKQPLYSAVNISLQLENAEVHHRILHRFARVVIFKLCKEGESMAVVEALHQAQLHVDRQPEKLVQEVDRMLAAGSKYCHLAQRLGGLGILAFLPQCGGPSLWENHIGKSGPAFESVIKKLQDDGLPAQSEPYHELAGDIIAVGKADLSTAELVQKHGRTNRSPDRLEHTRKRPRVAREERTAEAFQSSNIQAHCSTGEPPSQMGPATLFTLPRVTGEQSSSNQPGSTDSTDVNPSTQYASLVATPFEDSATFIPNPATSSIQGNGHKNGILGSPFDHMSSLKDVQPGPGPSSLSAPNWAETALGNFSGFGDSLGNFSGFGDSLGNFSEFGDLFGPQIRAQLAQENFPDTGPLLQGTLTAFNT